MINQELFYKELRRAGVEFFCGVPDSHLNAFCTFLANNVSDDKHMITANEGNAISVASGYHFATGTVPLVYMQNSGMGNALNPLLSLTDRHVYSVPIVLLIGWRGDPAEKDHEQHKTQGEITPKLLELLEIPYRIIEDNDDVIKETVEWAVQTARKISCPAALIAKKGVMAEKEKKAPPFDDRFSMCREDVIKVVLDHAADDAIMVATTGRATRELYFLREERGETHNNDILNVGAMGHASSIAMGVALAHPDRQVICLDGDAAAIMHLGAMTMTSRYPLRNYIHIILNNGAHESVGGQPSVGQCIDFAEIAQGCGYRRVVTIENEEELVEALVKSSDGNGSVLINARIKQGMRPVLPPLNIDHNTIIDGFKKQNIKKEF